MDDLIGAVFEVIGEAVPAIVEGAGEAISSVASGAGDLISSAVDGVGSMISSDAVTSVVETVSEVTPSVIETTANVAVEVIQTQMIVDGVQATGELIGAGIQAGIETFTNNNGDKIEIKTDEQGTKTYLKNGQLHRDEDLPAIEKLNGDKEWWINGQRHRDNNQVSVIKLENGILRQEFWSHNQLNLIDLNGDFYYFKNNELEKIYFKDNSKEFLNPGCNNIENKGNFIKKKIDHLGLIEYFQDGLVHKDSNLGPARINPNGTKEYVENGVLLKTIYEDGSILDHTTGIKTKSVFSNTEKQKDMTRKTEFNKLL